MTSKQMSPLLPKPTNHFTVRWKLIPIFFLPDLSRNKLVEVPGECTNYYSLERLLLYHNIIKSIPDTIAGLQSLIYLDLR